MVTFIGYQLNIKESEMKIKFQNVGWKSKIAKKRATYSISINKLVAIGANLEKGNTLYSYLAEDENKRVIIVTYLDGKKRKDLNRT